MTRRVLASAVPTRRIVTWLAAASFAAMSATVALAQQPAPVPITPPPAKQPPAKQPAKQPPAKQPAAKQQTPPPAQPQPQQATPVPQQPQQPQQLPVIYSPWTKFCGKDQNNPAAKEVCLTVKEARLETGQFLAGAALIEQQGEEKKLFRITLPLGMQLPQGTRLILDQEQPLSGRFVVCLPNGCMADFEVDGVFVGKLKKGQQLMLQGINLPGQAATYPLPLQDFAKANEGPPTDPKKFEEEQKKLQDELARKAEEARKRLQGTTPVPGAPPGTPGMPAPTR